jgi:hypothetical protein
MLDEVTPPASTVPFSAGGYSYIPGVSQYSAGVSSLPGYSIQRVRFTKPLPILEGFRRIEQILKEARRPLTAFCACELRSPAPFTEKGFKAFNETYIGVLKGWALADNGMNPVARSCVCPEIDPPKEPVFYAFSYTTEEAGPPSFVVAGSGEVPEGRSSYREHIVRRGDLTLDGLREKTVWVLGEMERRMAAFGAGWHDTTAVQVYTVHDIHQLQGDPLIPRGASAPGLTWHFARPPVEEIEYEMDCRKVSREEVHRS